MIDDGGLTVGLSNWLSTYGFARAINSSGGAVGGVREFGIFRRGVEERSMSFRSSFFIGVGVTGPVY